VARKIEVGLIDRAIAAISPSWARDREKARIQLLKARGARAEYDGATQGRRGANWKRKRSDANAELNPRVMMALNSVSHDLVRNNPFAASVVGRLAEAMVGTGITYQVYRGDSIDMELTTLARKHFDTTACDAEGRQNLYGLQMVAARSLITSGAVIQRRRWRRASDRLPVPMQLQLIEPDYIDMSKHGAQTGGGFAVHGIAFSAIGKRSGYWLYSGHPGATQLNALTSKLIDAADVAHCYRTDRPEQQHGATWFAPVILRMKDFGEYEDAQLVRQKIAACFTAFRIGSDDVDVPEADTDSNGLPLEVNPLLEQLEPGMIEDLGPGQDVKFASPPGVDGYVPYSNVSLHAIAAGVGCPYEVMTGDMSGVSFISGRLRLLDYRRSVQGWQWNVLIPQLCEPAGRWFLEAAEAMGKNIDDCSVRWTPPQFAMMDPATEIPAIRDAIRSGQQTPSGAARERGEDPDVFFAELAEDFKRFDALGLTLDCDPRKVTQVGNAVQPSSAARDAVPSKGT
jgi:lambda family phage portal protein